MVDPQQTGKEMRPLTDSIECGIDLGTTNSLCVWVTSVDSQSQSQALINFQFAFHGPNQRITPSVVSVSPLGEILVGLGAVENEFENPGATIHSIKRLMGRRFDDKEVVKLRNQVSYQIEADEAGMAVVVLGGKRYTPTEISAMILKRIKDDAEKQFGKKVTHAVVSVPAYFDNNQLNATREAARQAGFFVKRIVSEPVAASYAYGHGLMPGKIEKLLVFDMGGGTFDVTVIRSASPLSTVVEHAGDMWLGGDDIDADLVNIKRGEIEKQFGVDPKVDPSFMVELAREVRRAKEVICHADRESEGLRLNRPIEVSGDGVTERLVKVKGISVSQEEVARAASPLVTRAMELVKQAVIKANTPVRDIDRVILVGGSSSLIGVEDALRQMFPPDRIAIPQEPMAAVALGCGILARKIIGVECSKGHVNDLQAVTCANPECRESLEPFVDKTPLSYGIEVKGGGFEKILEKGTICPTSKPAVKTFFTKQPNQAKIYIPVYQGEEAIAVANRLQGFVTVQLSSPMPVDTPVEVRMSINRDRILEIEVVCDGQSEQAILKSGDWSTSLRQVIERARGVITRPEVIDEGERVLNEWQSAPHESEKERQMESVGKEILVKLRELHQEWLLQVPIEFLMIMSGEEGSRLPYLETFDHSLQALVNESLERYRAFKAGEEGEDQYSVERAIRGAIEALLRDMNGKCLFLLLLRGRKDSTDPDDIELARNLEELNLYLQQYQEAKTAENETTTRQSLDRARNLLARITNYHHYKRVLDNWDRYEAPDFRLGIRKDHGLPSDVDTRAVRTRR